MSIGVTLNFQPDGMIRPSLILKKPPILSVSAVAKTIRLSRGIQLRPDLVPANLVYFYAIEYAPLSLWSQSRPEDEIKTPPRLIGFQFENN